LNVLKNYASNFKRYLLLASLSLIANDAFCFSENPTKVIDTGAGLRPETGSVLSMIMALLFVLFVIFVISWLAKKFNLTPASSEHFKLINSMSLGGRERIVVIEIQGEQHAIGVTNQSVNHLFKLAENIEKPTQQLTDNHLINKINKMFGYQAPEQKLNNPLSSKVKDPK
jgi:flagellar biosynthetic protein FliO